MWGSQGPFLKKRKAMASLPHVASTESPIKHSSSLPSFNNPSMESSPTSPSCFPSTSLPEFEGHLQPAQGSWHQNPATHLEKHFDFAEGHGDGGRLLPASFASTGVDSYSNAHFTNALMASGTWDSKLSYLSAAPNSILGNPTSIAGHRQGHMHAGLDYMHAGLEHMHTEAPLRKMMPSPQPFSEIEKFLNHSNLGPLNVGVSIDPSKEGLAIQGMNLAASHCLANFSTDPGFAERAARFSSFGNLGYSEAYLTVDGGKGMNRAAKHSGHRIMPKCSAPNSPNGPNNNNNSSVQEPNNFPAKEALLTEEPKKGLEKKTSFSPTRNSIFDGSEGAQKQHCISMNDSDESMGQDVSSSCERNNGGETTPSQGIAENLGRKRKAGSKQKSKDGGGLAINPKDLDTDEGKSKWQNSGDSALEKEQKPKVEQSNSGNSGDSTPKSVKESSKPPEVPKPDFIHVRARRGQATDSHSLAERVRREKISERMKYLQDLVPGCSKVTGKAVMLDEIINYVQSLQRQVEFLSMKLAAVNPRVEFNIDNLFGRERIQPRIPLPAFVFTPENANPYPPLHPHQQPHAPLQVFGSCPPLDVHSFGSDPASRQTLSTPPSMDAYGDAVSQAWDDELQSVVQMGFAQGKQTPLASPDLQGELFPGQMKVEH